MAEKVLILGLSKSGIAAAIEAKALNYDVYITESKESKEEFTEKVKELKELGVHIETGGHSEEFISEAKFAITSPGIPPKSEIFGTLQRKNIPIISEIEFAYRNTKTPFIVITGTNGKTTTTTLIYKIIKKQYPNTVVAGNIGYPITSVINKIN